MSHAFAQAKLFKVVRGAEDRPVYQGPDVWTPDSEETIEQFIDKAKGISAQQHAKDEGNAVAHRHGDDFAGGGRGLDRLDIQEKYKSGVCLYIFVLNVPYGRKDRLLFVENGDRFITLPLNSSTNEDSRKFVKEVKELGVNRRIAAFEVDLDAVHKSPLAERIRKSDHNDVLYIPFYFNVTDPDPSIEAAPWVHSGHGAHHHGDGEESGSDTSHRHEGRRTHGGVHPDTMALFGAEL